MRLRLASSLLVASSVLGWPLAEGSRPASAQEKDAKSPAASGGFPNTPEGVFKAFVVAMATGDEKALREVTLPAEGFERLLKGEHVPPEHRAEFRKEIETRLALKRLKPGDRFTPPGGREITVADDEVAEDRAVILPEGAPIPTRCRQVKGRWMVDARPLIAARQADKAARKGADKTKGEVPESSKP